MQTYLVQARQAQLWEDIYVDARNEAEAVEKARKLTTLDLRWAYFVL